jgi:hypothetical protein
MLGLGYQRAPFRRRQRQRLFLLAATAGLVSLVQFPFAAGMYFCFAAPFVLVAGVFTCQRFAALPRRLLLCAAAGYTLFAALWFNHGDTFQLGFTFVPRHLERLDCARGGLWVDQQDARLYSRLLLEIEGLSRPGDFIYATPESPEVYFLSGRRNPTRTLFDFLDADLVADPKARTTRILKRLDECHVQVVVLRREAEFTPPLPDELLGELRRRYPYALDLPLFEIRHRVPESAQRTREHDGNAGGTRERRGL